MQLGVLIALATLAFIAFSIGLNLGLHGALAGHTSVLERRPSRGPPPSGAEQLSRGSDAANEEQQKQEDVKIDTKKRVAPPRPRPKPAPETRPPSPPPPPPLPQQPLGAMQWSKARLLIEGVKETSSYKDNVAVATSRVTTISTASRKGTLEAFLASGGQFPIVLLTATRAKMLQVTLASIFSVRGVQKKNVLVVQDGLNAEVDSVVRGAGIALVQNLQNMEMIRQRRDPIDGAELIARHYKFALTTAFDRFPDAPALIIIEDDLLLSPDFYEYFHAVAPILCNDPSLFVISAWNDNGFKGKVRDPLALSRTEFFPGLGWLLPRHLYKSELEQQWPQSHWDHWLRSPQIHKGREIVYPQIPRSYHNGVLGTFMNLETHNRYFRDIDYNQNRNVAWPSPTRAEVFVGAMSTVYEARISQLLTTTCVHIESVKQIAEGTSGVYCVWIKVDPEPPEYQPPEFERIARFFGLWHEHKRGSHRGLHEFFFEDSYILLLNVFDPSKDRINGMPGIFVGSYLNSKPASAAIMHPRQFDPRLLLEGRRRRLKIASFSAQQAGQSCTQVCAALGKQCNAQHLPLLNTCEALREQFPCAGCSESLGHEQPAYVIPTAEDQFGPRRCLVNSRPEQTTCDAQHRFTKRLCACT